MARTDPQVNMRMPAELKDSLQQAALANGRSLNAEIVQRLDESFKVAARISAQIAQQEHIIHDEKSDSSAVAKALLQRQMHEMMFALQVLENMEASRTQEQSNASTDAQPKITNK
ncbi:Arc family DNA-binding protein [Chromobacterium vaccinii]|uniref:Arc family DNA-binding protein n=1 Tax=Chromobacterium vaccinii TaxID=1108595 RepID=UPI003C7737F5